MSGLCSAHKRYDPRCRLCRRSGPRLPPIDARGLKVRRLHRDLERGGAEGRVAWFVLWQMGEVCGPVVL